MPMIEIQHVSKWYSETFQVLKDCTASVEKGEVVVVCGPSGSGKSTLIKTVNGLEPFQEGEIFVNGINVGDPKTNLPKLRTHIGMVFQHFELFPHLSIIDNLTLAQMKVLGRSREEATERGLNLLNRVHLSKHALKFPGQLSGGQQQRVAIARALAMDPVCMLFDEPTSAINALTEEKIYHEILFHDHSSMKVFITHHMSTAASADFIVVLDHGKIVESGTHAELMARKGWQLEKVGSFFWTYRQEKPAELHYAITYFPYSQFQGTFGEPAEDQATYCDYCAAAGWQLVCCYGPQQVFVSDRTAPVPIETDEKEKLTAIHRSTKKTLLLPLAILLPLMLVLYWPTWGYPAWVASLPGGSSILYLSWAVLPFVLTLCMLWLVADYLVW